MTRTSRSGTVDEVVLDARTAVVRSSACAHERQHGLVGRPGRGGRPRRSAARTASSSAVRSPRQVRAAASRSWSVTTSRCARASASRSSAPTCRRRARATAPPRTAASPSRGLRCGVGQRARCSQSAKSATARERRVDAQRRRRPAPAPRRRCRCRVPAELGDRGLDVDRAASRRAAPARQRGGRGSPSSRPRRLAARSSAGANSRDSSRCSAVPGFHTMRVPRVATGARRARSARAGGRPAGSRGRRDRRRRARRRRPRRARSRGRRSSGSCAATARRTDRAGGRRSGGRRAHVAATGSASSRSSTMRSASARNCVGDAHASALGRADRRDPATGGQPRTAVSASNPRSRPAATSASSRSPKAPRRPSRRGQHRHRRRPVRRWQRRQPVGQRRTARQHLAGVHERGQGRRDAVGDGLPALLLRLQRVPVGLDLLGRVGGRLAEHVRVAGHQLGHDAVGDVVDRPRIVGVLGGDAGMEHHLQQQVAELLAQAGAIGRPRSPRPSRRPPRRGTRPGTRASAGRPTGSRPGERSRSMTATRSSSALPGRAARASGAGISRARAATRGRRAPARRQGRAVPGAEARAHGRRRARRSSRRRPRTTAWPCSSADPLGASFEPSVLRLQVQRHDRSICEGGDVLLDEASPWPHGPRPAPS